MIFHKYLIKALFVTILLDCHRFEAILSIKSLCVLRRINIYGYITMVLLHVLYSMKQQLFSNRFSVIASV